MLINPPVTFAVTVIIIKPVNFVETIIIVIASCLQNVSYSNDYLLLQHFFLKYSEAFLLGERVEVMTQENIFIILKIIDSFQKHNSQTPAICSISHLLSFFVVLFTRRQWSCCAGWDVRIECMDIKISDSVFLKSW